MASASALPLPQDHGHVRRVLPPRDVAVVFRALTTLSLDRPLSRLARDFGFFAFLKRQPYKIPP